MTFLKERTLFQQIAGVKRITDPYFYLYIYAVIFVFAVKIKAYKSGDLNKNKAPEAEVPEGTGGPHQLIRQVLQERWKRSCTATHACDADWWQPLAGLQCSRARAVSVRHHLPGKTEGKVRAGCGTKPKSSGGHGQSLGTAWGFGCAVLLVEVGDVPGCGVADGSAQKCLSPGNR